jgi:hypothetical protein
VEEAKKKGGIWVGRRGLSQGCDHNQQARDAIYSGLQNQLNDLFALLREVEAAIDAAGSVLSISQPARISGKYGLRWWRVKPGLPYHEPVVVRWVMQRNGKMTPKRAKILKAKDGGSFAINAAETQECLEILSGLIKRRKEIKGRIFSISKSLRGFDRVSYRLNNEAERIESLRSQVISNLLENGYEVEPRLMEACNPD